PAPDWPCDAQHSIQQPWTRQQGADRLQPWWFRRMAPLSLQLPTTAEQCAVVDLGRTDRFAAPTVKAVVEVAEVDGGRVDAFLRQRLDQADAPARRLALLSIQRVGRAVRQAQAAEHALVGEP